MTEQTLYPFIAGLFGLLFGSFLNVCIYRWTRDLSVIKPRSACPQCNHMIAAYDNIPVVSYLLLRGRCRHCKATIPWTYPTVELLTAIFFAYIVAIEGPHRAALKDCAFAAIMIGLIFADLDTRLLPDEFTIGGFVAGLVFSPFVPFQLSSLKPLLDTARIHAELHVIRFGEALLGALVPAGSMWLLGWIFEKLRHKEHLGFGDVKMIAMMGAFLGLGEAVNALLLGSLLGSIIGLAWLKITGKDPATYYLPFASFLGAGGLIMVAIHDTHWYLALIHIS
jgi:leader peptidase (prepilin peptidase)/N-methyltransferase